ncbi:MAG: hypothetical protein ACYS22_07250 [Planctomycetota bacterium]
MGARAAAEEAAVRLGIQAARLVPFAALAGEVKQPVLRTIGISQSASGAALRDAALHALDGKIPDAVLAVTEWAILPAARLRAALGLSANALTGLSTTDLEQGRLSLPISESSEARLRTRV